MDLIIYKYFIDKEHLIILRKISYIALFLRNYTALSNSFAVCYQNTYIIPCDVIKKSSSLLQISRPERK